MAKPAAMLAHEAYANGACGALCGPGKALSSPFGHGRSSSEVKHT